eukprot:jgi/Mesen1/2364/ME000156S01513
MTTPGARAAAQAALSVAPPSAPASVNERASIPPPAHPTYDILSVIKLALAEDAGDQGDVTCLATIPAEVQAKAVFLAKADGVLAGIAVADMVFSEVDPTLQAMARAAKPARILETRKTAPGLRLFDKWAVLIGGGENHRMGLYDMVMIKDNHIAAAGGIPQAVAAAQAYLQQQGLDIGVEVETRTLEEVKEVLSCAGEGQGRVTRVMLDNMVTAGADGSLDVSMLEAAASGNVTLDTVSKIGATGVTFISSGALTHSVKALDISLNIDTELALAVGKRTNRA